MIRKVLIRFLVLSIVSTALAAAQSAASKKVPAAIVDSSTRYYAISPEIAADGGCAKDFMIARASTGVDARKQMADVLQYDCIELFHGFYLVSLMQGVAVTVWKEVMIPVEFVYDSESNGRLRNKPSRSWRTRRPWVDSEEKIAD